MGFFLGLSFFIIFAYIALGIAILASIAVLITLIAMGIVKLVKYIQNKKH